MQATEEKARNRERDQSSFDPSSTLLWWCDKPFKGANLRDIDKGDLLDHILQESDEIVHGRHRTAMKGPSINEEERRSRKRETYFRNLDREIGEMKGIENDISDPMGIGTLGDISQFGYRLSEEFIAKIADPSENVTFYSKLKSYLAEEDTLLRAGEAY